MVITNPAIVGGRREANNGSINGRAPQGVRDEHLHQYHIASPSGIQGRPARLNELLPEPLEHVQEREERQRAKVRAALERLR